jgi:DnaJ homolog subfamily C member 7
LKKSKRKDYYKILDVDKGAGSSMIKTAYRKMAVKWHPDKHGNAEAAQQEEAERMFKDIGEAYSILSDQKKKEMYD